MAKRMRFWVLAVTTLLGGTALTACGERNVPRLPEASGVSTVHSSASPTSNSLQSTPSTETTQTTAPINTATPRTQPPAVGQSTGDSNTTTSEASVAPAAQTSQVESVYREFLHDISSLDDTLNASWIPDLERVTTARLTKAAEEQADTLETSHEHTVGTLVDDHETVVMTSSTTASLFDCLNEEAWYLVEDNSDQPDPVVSRGYYVGDTELVFQNGQWIVDIWQPAQGKCNF